RMESVSASSALDQAYEDHRERLNSVLEKLPAPEGACGAVFAYAGHIAGIDLFDKPTTLAKLWSKLIRSYAIDAVETPAEGVTPVTREAVRQWLQTTLQAKAETFKSPGLGDDIRLEGEKVVGAGLVVEDRPVHVGLFPHGMPA